jgi:hypothetical protein
MKNKTYKDFTQNPQFACPYAIRDLIKGLDSKDIRKLLILLMHHLQPIWKGLKGLRYPKTKEEIIQIVSQETSTLSREVLNLISSLPKRTAILQKLRKPWEKSTVVSGQEVPLV